MLDLLKHFGKLRLILIHHEVKFTRESVSAVSGSARSVTVAAMKSSSRKTCGLNGTMPAFRNPLMALATVADFPYAVANSSEIWYSVTTLMSAQRTLNFLVTKVFQAFEKGDIQRLHPVHTVGG